MRLLRLALAFLRRDLLSELSYKANFFFGLSSGFALLMIFFFVGRTVGFHTPHLVRFGGSYFGFAIIGLAASAPLHACLMELARRVRDAQVSGTLEAVLATPVGPARAILLSALHPIATSLLRMTLLVGGGALLFALPVRASGIPAAALVLAAALLGYLALGLFSAAFTLRFKRGDPLAFLIDSVSVLLGGVFYPVEVLPPPLRAASSVLPLTHALEALRSALLGDATIGDVLPAVLRLLAFAAVVAPLSLWAFRSALRKARDEGSLTHF